MIASRRLQLWMLVLVAGGPLAAQAQPGKQPSKLQNVRKWTRLYSPTKMLAGVVDAIDEKEMTVTDTDADPRRPKQYTLVPTDLLAEGKRLKDANGLMAYHWADVKKGDSVTLMIAFDDGEQQWYCATITITHRPGAKLPASHEPKEDRRYARDNLLNDIDNGEDVDDDVIARTHPARPSGGPGDPGKPAGLSEEYRKKLDAIRAKKKDGGLNATPPDKK